MKYTVILSLLVFVLFQSCTQPSKPDLSEDLKSFFKENQLDKRTSFLEVSKNGKEITGQTTDTDLAKRFVEYYNQKHNSKSENNIEVLTPQIGYAHNSVSNVRTEPKHGAELATQYLMGQELKVLKEQEGWYYVQGPDNYLGWLDGGGLLFQEKTSPDWINAPKVVFQKNEGEGYFTDRPDQAATDLVFGNILGKLEGNNYVTPDGRKIIIPDPEAFEKSSKTEPVDLVFERAYSLLGRPYLWGGTSPKAVDCSGFTRTSFLNAGYLLGRDASLQVHEGEEINKDDQSAWLPGDLLFFGNLREDGSERISHVAIHIGNGDIIHSAQWVKIESLNKESELFNEDRFNTLMHVKRIF